MSHRPEPDDVDLFVGGVEPDTQSALETERFIEEYKKRPGHALEAEEAERILAAFGISRSATMGCQTLSRCSSTGTDASQNCTRPNSVRPTERASTMKLLGSVRGFREKSRNDTDLLPSGKTVVVRHRPQ